MSGEVSSRSERSRLNRARGRCLAVGEPERLERAVLAEDAFAGAKDDRVDHHSELVDQVVLDQRPYQLGAADHVQV